MHTSWDLKRCCGSCNEVMGVSGCKCFYEQLVKTNVVEQVVQPSRAAASGGAKG